MVEGRTGWLTSPGSPYVEAVLASRVAPADEKNEQSQQQEDGRGAGLGLSGREAVIASDPGFSAIPSAFARALPSSAVVGVGVNDTMVQLFCSMLPRALTAFKSLSLLCVIGIVLR